MAGTQYVRLSRVNARAAVQGSTCTESVDQRTIMHNVYDNILIQQKTTGSSVYIVPRLKERFAKKEKKERKKREEKSLNV